MMELFSLFSMSFDMTSSVVITIIALIGVYWFWFKPRSSSSTKPEDMIKTIRNLQPFV